MSKLFQLVVVAVVLALMIDDMSAITCNSCESSNTNRLYGDAKYDCRNAFVECPTTSKYCITEETAGSTYKTYCAPKTMTANTQCDAQNGNSTDAAMHQVGAPFKKITCCKTDRCNSSNSFMSNQFLIVTLALAAFFGKNSQ